MVLHPVHCGPPAPAPVVCNGCLVLIDPEWEPVVRIGEFSFHQSCAPACAFCGRPLWLKTGRGEAGRLGADGNHSADSQDGEDSCIVLDSRVGFLSSRGYQVALTACCCRSCYQRMLVDEPPALA